MPRYEWAIIAVVLLVAVIVGGYTIGGNVRNNWYKQGLVAGISEGERHMLGNYYIEAKSLTGYSGNQTLLQLYHDGVILFDLGLQP
ncbi:hypothetical protein LCGC14_3092170 [marine sediment metagenome]|uniref:Uncharacterized protein n=1 Tax=marine sediment metagenome TaxID=412755 RepID=A0A0F8Z0J4_9ZZZZ